MSTPAHIQRRPQRRPQQTSTVQPPGAVGGWQLAVGYGWDGIHPQDPRTVDPPVLVSIELTLRSADGIYSSLILNNKSQISSPDLAFNSRIADLWVGSAKHLRHRSHIFYALRTCSSLRFTKYWSMGRLSPSAPSVRGIAAVFSMRYSTCTSPADQPLAGSGRLLAAPLEPGTSSHLETLSGQPGPNWGVTSVGKSRPSVEASGLQTNCGKQGEIRERVAD